MCWSHQWRAEFDALSGRSVLSQAAPASSDYISVVSGAPNWNRITASQPPILVTVLDNFIAVAPGWLMALEKDRTLRLLKHQQKSSTAGEGGGQRGEVII